MSEEEINGARREERAEERAKESARNEGQTKLAQTKINLDKSSLASKYNYGNKHTHARVTGPVPKSGEEGGEGEGERSGREWAVGGPTESYFGSAIIKHLKTHENNYQTG